LDVLEHGAIIPVYKSPSPKFARGAGLFQLERLTIFCLTVELVSAARQIISIDLKKKNWNFAL
jgi:hypothetical protein